MPAQTPDQAQKYNRFMPEWSAGPALGFMIDRPISAEGFTHNFLPRLKNAVDRYGEVRLTVYFKAYQGWEEDAAAQDLAATMAFGKYITRLALVNPSERLVALFKIKQPLLAGEMRFFAESELRQAVDWANNPGTI